MNRMNIGFAAGSSPATPTIFWHDIFLRFATFIPLV
jgi:hypothetical protein